MGERGEVVGFLGLSTVPAVHRFTIDGRIDDRPAWTWCAQDGLFLPELLDQTARIESRDPASGEAIRLTVSPTRVEADEPKGIVVSMMPSKTADLTSAAGVIATVCHFIFFFASRASGERWAAERPGTLLLSFDEAFACGKRQNALLFRAELSRRRGRWREHGVNPEHESRGVSPFARLRQGG